ncbi:MAG TPA: DegV family protein [Bacillota bacterium]|jgi:fatty acid-binding protein DegV
MADRRPTTILCDSCCDLPRGLLEARKIKLIPLTVIFDTEEYKDGVDISPPEFYARVRRDGAIPHTSQITVPEYSDFFGRAVAEDGEAVYIGLSSGLSGSLNNAVAAAGLPELNGRVRVVDSLGASVGLGLIVLKAADLAEAGSSAAEIAAELGYHRATVSHLFILDTLEFARKTLAKVQGRRKAVGRLFEEMERLGANPAGRRVGVNHADDPETAAALVERFKSQYRAGEVVVGEIGPTVGSHVGPGCVSIFFEGPVNRGY